MGGDPASGGAATMVYTSQEEAPPLSLLEFGTDDTNGSCSSRFMRASMYRVPATGELLNMTTMPMAIAVQPFAPTSAADKRIGVVDFGTEDGPVRCDQCRG
jgi:protein transport protein SEC24